MNRILVAKNLAVAQNKAIADLTVGQIGIYGMGLNDQLWKPVGKLTKAEWLQVYVGGEYLPSGIIDAKPAASHWTKIPYSEGVKPVWRFSTAHKNTSVYDEWVISITGTNSLGSGDHWTETFSATGNLKTPFEVYCALEKKIDASKYYTAVADKGGLIVTTKELGQDFTLGAYFVPDPTSNCSNGCCSVTWDAKKTVEAAAGSGSATQVRELQFKYRPSLGNMSFTEVQHPFPEILPETSTDTFDLYIGTYSNPNDAGGDQSQSVFKMEHTLVIAVPAGSVAGTGFRQVIEAQLGKTFIDSPIV
jgi:hypothetical protein